jgi:hypothetical protein
MDLIGDSGGLAELKKLKNDRKDFLRFLITEAKTSISQSSTFKGSDGRYWVLSFDAQRNVLSIGIGTKPQ